MPCRYWMIGYSRDAGAYFTYLLLMFCTSLSMSGLFRFIGSIAATPVHAQVRVANMLFACNQSTVAYGAHTAWFQLA